MLGCVRLKQMLYPHSPALTLADAEIHIIHIKLHILLSHWKRKKMNKRKVFSFNLGIQSDAKAMTESVYVQELADYTWHIPLNGDLFL